MLFMVQDAKSSVLKYPFCTLLWPCRLRIRMKHVPWIIFLSQLYFRVEFGNK